MSPPRFELGFQASEACVLSIGRRRRILCVPVCHRRRAEGVGLDYGIKAIAPHHADDAVYKFARWAVFADVNVNLLVPEKFISQFFFEPPAQFLRQSYGMDGFLINSFAESVAARFFGARPKMNPAVANPPNRDGRNKLHFAPGRGICANDDFIFSLRL